MKAFPLRCALILFVAVLLSVFAVVPRAFAVAPTRQELPFDPFTITNVCAFPVLMEPLSNNEKIMTFYDKNGNEIFSTITGTLKVRLTNEETGASVKLNISGPVRIQSQQNGSQRITYRGASLLWFPVPSNLPALAFTHGPIVTEIDAEGTFSVVSTRGHAEDVCAMLSGT